MNKILIVDDEHTNLSSLKILLEKKLKNAQCLTATSSEQAEKLLREQPLVAILDLNLNRETGVESGYNLLNKITKQDPTIRVIVLTGHTAEEYGIKALGIGASNFFTKPIVNDHFIPIVQDSLVQAKLKRSYLNFIGKEELSLQEKIIGSSKHTKELINAISFASRSEQAVLISGETGTGKGYTAELIHQISNRAKENFIKVQSVFNNSDLVSSELFGYQKGAFTGSLQDKKGLLAEANNGTLFLDEINSFSESLQVALLGVLQDKTYRALGSNKQEFSDFKLISASNQNLEQAINANKFRQDLYFRIAAIKIELLPLRDRSEDICDIAFSFAGNMSISSAAIKKLTDYSWPGNIRELQAVINNASELARFAGRSEIKTEDVNFMSVNLADVFPAKKASQSFHFLVNQYKSQIVQEALSRNQNSKAKTARELGIDRATVSKLAQKNY